MDHLIEIEKNWLETLILNQFAHNRAAVWFGKRDHMLGLLSTVLAAIVSTAIFASLYKSDNQAAVIISGAISIVATIFSAIHNYEKNGKIAEQHRNAALQYGVIRRNLELLLTDSARISRDALSEINKARSECAANAPVLPNKIYDKAKEDAKKHDLMKIFLKN